MSLFAKDSAGLYSYGQYTPGTAAEVADMASWERYDGLGIPVGSTTIDLAEERVNKYRLEVHDADGALVAHIPRWWGGSYRETGNEARTLRFTIPYADAATIDAGLTGTTYPTHTVWLRDRFGLCMGIFWILDATPEQEGEASLLHVVCHCGLGKLAAEWVYNYEAAAGTEIRDIIEGLLEEQLGDNPITLGKIDKGIAKLTRGLKAYHVTVLRALLDLQQTVDSEMRGYLWVDSRRRLNWSRNLGSQAGTMLAVGANLAGVTVERDRSEVCTQLYAYGSGLDPANALNLVDAGEPVEFLYGSNDSITKFGIVPVVKEWKHITDAATLLAAAQAYVDDHDDEVLRFRVAVIDLANADGDRWDGWEDIYLGSRVRVYAPSIEIDHEVYVVSIERNLDDPLDITVELSNKREDIAEILADREPVFDVRDGDRYPNVARLFNDPTDATLRPGDLRHVEGTPDGHMEFQDTDGDWKGIAGSMTAWDDDPLDIAPEPDAGATSEYARGDHVHGGFVLSDDTPEDVGTTGAAGTSTEVSRADHVHAQQTFTFVTATTKANLPTNLSAPAMGYATTTKRYYVLLDGTPSDTWLCVSHWETS